MTINFNDITDTATPTSGTFNTGGNANVKGGGQNLIFQSSNLTVSPWGATNLTVTGGQSDPFGGTTAALLNDGTAAGAVHYLTNSFSTLALNTYTFSCYAKSGTTNYFGLYDNNAAQGAFFNLTTGVFTANIVGAPNSYSITNAGNGWWRVSITITNSVQSQVWLIMSEDGTNYSYTGTSKTVYAAGPQFEIGSVANTYVPTTTTLIYNTPQLTFSGVANIGLQSDGALFVQPAGTGALQAQATTSSATGGNARGANSVDWQTTRDSAAKVASAVASVISGGYAGQASGGYSVLCGGFGNAATGTAAFTGGGSGNGAGGSYAFVGGGGNNASNGYISAVVGGQNNTSSGYYNFIGGGYVNSGTSASAVTTQSATMNGTTAVTLAASNASIKVGQYISGTSIGSDTYVAAVSGTSLTLSKVATGSSTSTLSFYTPHGIVVGGGNNQATGSYSFIGGGGDAGTAANRNVASGDWSAVVGGIKNTASGPGSFVGGGGFYYGSIFSNTASGNAAAVVGGITNNATGPASFVSGGFGHISDATYSTVLGGASGRTRGINGNTVIPANAGALTGSNGNAQSALLVLARETTNATATVLTSDTSAASTTNQVILPNNAAYYFTGTCIANVTGAAAGAAWSFEGAIMRGANAGSTVLIGTPVLNRVAVSSGASLWAVALTADTSNGGLAVTVTGVASTTIRWVAKLETTEVTY